MKEIRDALGVKAIARSISGDGEQKQLRDAQLPYSSHFDSEKGRLSQNIRLEWDVYSDI